MWRRAAGWAEFFVATGLAMGPVALAQAQAGGGRPFAPVLSPANGSCPRDDVSSGAPRTVVATPSRPEPDIGCAISVAETLPWLDAADTVFIDTRPPVEHAQFGIRGAVNMPALDLRTKHYLRAKRLVLFGNGKGEQELYRACAQLKREGFSQVRVIRGGLPMWQLSRQPLIGNSVPADGAVMVDAAGLLQEAGFDDNVVLVSPMRREVQASLSFSVLLEQPNVEAIQAVLDRRKRELKGAPMAAVVLVAGKELSEEQLWRIRQALNPTPLLVYADSTDALTRQVERQRAIWSAHARGPKKPACGT